MKLDVLYLLGPAGSFSDEATELLRGKKFRKRYVSSLHVLRKRLGGSGYILLPMRNKIIGKIADFSGFLKKEKRKPRQIVRLPICFVLACHDSVSASQITKIYVSRIAKAQCAKYLKKYYPNVRFMFTESTSSSYKKVVQLEGKKAENVAAIGSERAAKEYGLRVIKKHIEDLRSNWTEFALVQGGATRTRKKDSRRD